MKFVLSATVNASDLRQVLKLWDESGDPRNPFENVLISPLFIAPSTLKIVYEQLKGNRHSTVYFDSGGYYVQQGRIDYETLYDRLRKCYQEYTWADWYVLPDHVPTSKDSPEIVAGKVHDTITAARMFASEMSPDTRARILPVVQGHTEKQIFECVDTYIQMGAPYIGFGSFGTSGASNQMNMVTDQSLRMLKLLSTLGTEKGFNLHLFGVSTPPILYVFERLGVYSFDSLAWMKAAGYGNVFLPFVRGYMVTYRIYDRTHTYQEQFDYLKELTGHRCVFCEDFSKLVNHRMYRILHNLTSVLDTLDILATGKNGFGQSARSVSDETILQVVREGSPSYLRYYEAINEQKLDVSR
jgi:queuine/archaeosine tRNA-ribosyltransferase